MPSHPVDGDMADEADPDLAFDRWISQPSASTSNPTMAQQPSGSSSHGHDDRGTSYAFSQGSQSPPPEGQSALSAAARRSQRQPLSCTECTRRKTRCSKIIPCENCIKRGKTADCRLEITVKEPATQGRQNNRAAQSQIEELRQATASTTDHLNHRLTSLESLFSGFVTQFPAFKPDDQPRPTAHSIEGPGQRGLITASADQVGNDSLQMMLESLGSAGPSRARGTSAPRLEAEPKKEDEGDGEADAEADAAATLEFLAMGRSRAKSTGALLGANALHSSDGLADDDEEDELDDDDDRANMDGLEGHGLHAQGWAGSSGGDVRPVQGQRRPSLPPQPSSLMPQRPRSLTSSSLPSASARLHLRLDSGSSTFPSSSHTPTLPPISNSSSAATSPSSNMPPPPAPTAIPTPRSNSAAASTPASAANGRAKTNSRSRHSVMAMIPSEEIGRKLCAYDMEMVVWMHCAYHVPTFASECELFWEEGASGQVEVNKAWLAMLFGVLMSALHHMPLAESMLLFPGESIPGILNRYFDACLQSLHEANWMGSHSLYSVQCLAIIVSPANHLGKSDLYFTQLATAIRIAQALNINHLGPDIYPAPAGTVVPPMDPRALITREVCKRTWWQLVIQDFFHLPFNRSCAISLRQFDSAVPFHCHDEQLFEPSSLQTLSIEVPTVDSHTIQLLKLAVLVHELFDGLHATKSVPYSMILTMDEKAKAILAEAPRWMQLDKNDNPYPLPKNAPKWLEWQRMSYLVSSAHKVIILHRPFLGRAFRDSRYKLSRDTCVKNARRILRCLRSCELEEFRKTWTVLAHSVAASIILILEFSHEEDLPTRSPSSVDGEPGPLQIVCDAVEIFRSLAHTSTIAAKGVTVISALIEEQLRKRSGGGGGGSLKRKAPNDTGYGRTEVELERAIKVLRRKPSSAITPNGAPAGSASTSNNASSSSGFNGYPFPSPSSNNNPSHLQSYNPHQPQNPSFAHPASAPTPPPFQLPAHTVPTPYSPYLTGQGPLDAVYGTPAAFHHPHIMALQSQLQSQAQGGQFSVPSPQQMGMGAGMYMQSGGGGDQHQTLFGSMDGMMEGFDLSSLLEFDGGGSYML